MEPGNVDDVSQAEMGSQPIEQDKPETAKPEDVSVSQTASVIDDVPAADLDISDEQLAELRLNYLIHQGALMSEQTTLMDAKASAILVVALFYFSNLTISGSSDAQGHAILILSNGLIILSLIFALMAVVPRRLIRGEADADFANERFSWVGLSDPQYGLEKLTAALPSLSFEEMARQLAISNQAMAQTIQRKYFFGRYAFLTAAAGFVIVVLAHSWGLLAKSFFGS